LQVQELIYCSKKDNRYILNDLLIYDYSYMC
jgi:hypothetical protein